MDGAGEVLDRMDTPTGPATLIAYARDGLTWIGVGDVDGRVSSAIGLRSGSLDHQIECSAHVQHGWGLSFGAVSEAIVRVEIRNERGEGFSGRILEFPAGLGLGYKPVWGSRERCSFHCEVVGWDAAGNEYGEQDPLGKGEPPTDLERLRAIRDHGDVTMRQLANSVVRTIGAERDLQMAYLSIVANFMALIEGPALGVESMLARRDRIIRRYIDEATANPEHPGVCSYCGERPVVAWFEGPTFDHAVSSPDEVRASEAMLACATCRDLKEAGDTVGLEARATRRFLRRDR